MPKGKTKAPETAVLLSQQFEPHCPIDSLELDPSNPRQGDGGAIYTSIEKNGFYGAVIVQQGSNRIIAGKHRFLAAKALGATAIPVLFVNVSDTHARRLMVADNRTSDLADYDNQALADLLEQVRIDTTELGFAGTGWDEESFQNLMNDLSGSIFAADTESKDGRSQEPKTVFCPKCSHEFTVA